MSDGEKYLNTRTSPRVEVPEEVVIFVESFGQFLEQHAQDISEGGMFLRSAAPPPAGTRLQFAIRLSDGYPLIRGKGEVVWSRKRGPGPDSPGGMGIRFVELSEQGKQLVRRLVEERRGPRETEGEEGAGAGEQEPAKEVPRPQELVQHEDIAAGPASTEVNETPDPFGELVSKLEEKMSRVEDGDPFLLEPEIPPADQPAAASDEFLPPVEGGQDSSLGGTVSFGEGTGTSEGDSFPPVELPEIGRPVGFYEDDEEEAMLPPSRSPWFWPFAIPVLALALAALGYGLWEMGYLGWAGLPGPASPRGVQANVTATAQPTVRPEPTNPTPLSEEGAENPASIAAVMVTPTRAPVSPSPTPVPTATRFPAHQPVVAPASAVKNVTWRRTADGVEVRIRLNGRLESSSARLTRLDSPPRGLLRIKHMRTHYEPTEIPVGVGGLEKIRLWLHDEMSPPQMYVVFDLSEPSRRLTQELEDGDLIITVR